KFFPENTNIGSLVSLDNEYPYKAVAKKMDITEQVARNYVSRHQLQTTLKKMESRQTEIDPEALEEYIENTESMIESSPQLDEANTKHTILSDFLDLLGWEAPENTELEYTIEGYNKYNKVDYAFVSEGEPKAFIEAKGLDTTLTDQDQIREYLKTEDVDLGILTNGRRYEFFHRRIDDSKVVINKLMQIDVEDLSNHISILNLYTKNEVGKDSTDGIIDEIHNLKKTVDILRDGKDGLAGEMTELIEESVPSKKISQATETEAKEMIDRLVKDIENDIIPKLGGEVGGNDGSGEKDGLYIVEFEFEGDVKAVDGESQAEVMKEATDFLIRNKDLAEKIDVPWIPGNKKAVINDEPEWGKSSDYTYREVSDGYYVDTHAPKRQKKQVIGRMADRCDVIAKFKGEW
ncbi:MAG: type I restriction enzyme HsdR N-terminal domain-containing protein, partial [Halobacteria archaeon]